ncbi:MAG: hypothetical protein V3S48_08150 [Candidatus Neomarinimicrobiota bacterium]
MNAVRPVLIIILSFRFGACPDTTRMVKEFNYKIPQQNVLQLCSETIQNLDYELDIYAPETNFLVTKPKRLKGVLRRFDYALAIYVTDKIEVYIIAERHVFKRSSELSIGGRELVEKQVEDRLPIALQNKIFIPLSRAFEKLDFSEIQLTE